MDDKQLTIDAGKAIGLTGTWQRDSLKIDVSDMPGFFTSWYPLHNSGDALNILSELGARGHHVSLQVYEDRVVILLGNRWVGISEGYEPGGHEAATRIAIVKAAAHIHRENIIASVTVEDVTPFIDQAVAKAVAELPTPKDGISVTSEMKNSGCDSCIPGTLPQHSEMVEK
mgnify:CR=1 FL=1